MSCGFGVSLVAPGDASGFDGVASSPVSVLPDAATSTGLLAVDRCGSSLSNVSALRLAGAGVLGSVVEFCTGALAEASRACNTNTDCSGHLLLLTVGGNTSLDSVVGRLTPVEALAVVLHVPLLVLEVVAAVASGCESPFPV